MTRLPSPGREPTSQLPQRGVAAHRGGAARRPENTLAACREAVRCGAQQLEVDLRRSADGALVVMHDARVDRTTDGRGLVGRLTLAELRRLDAGRGFAPRYAGERIPTLDEVLDVVPPNVWLNLQVKRGEPIAAQVARTLARRDRLDHAFVAGGADALREARAAHPDVLVCDLERRASREEYVEQALRSGADFIQLHHLRGVPEAAIVERARRGGLRVNHFCTPGAAELEAVFRSGVHFALVDDVERGLEVAVRCGVARPVEPR